MGLRGSVRAFSLEQLLEFLNSSGHDGTLNVHHKDAQKILYLHKAGLYLERSSFSFRLGDALVRRGEVTPEQLESALATQQASEGKFLGQCLVELGHTTQEKIIEARRFQVEEEIYEVFGWEDAFFEFEKDVLPEDFQERIQKPEEFRFPSSSVLMEATRRRDEWRNIQEYLPSEKRLYVLSSVDGAVKRATRELTESQARVTDPQQVFDGMHTLSELPHLLGLSRFETLSLVSRLIGGGDVRQLMRQELESRFRMAIRSNVDYAIRLYQCALESPEFDSRGRFLDRVFFGNEGFKAAAEEGRVEISARVKGKRAFELLLSLFRQGIPCEFSAREEGREMRVAFSKASLVWRVAEGQDPPGIVKHLLARSPVSASDLVRVREMQEQTGRTLQQILVGGGYVTMENWFRAQKDTVLNELFRIFFLNRPYIEIRPVEERGVNAGIDIDVPLLPWLHAEVMKEIRQWETMLQQFPSVRAYLVVTSKGEKSVQGANDPTLLFDGQRSLEEVLELQQELSAAEFLEDVHTKLQSGRLAPLLADDYRTRLDAALEAGKRALGINYCLAAIESGIEADTFQERLAELRAAESELSNQSSRATLRGDLASFSLPEVLQTFHLRKSSGTMRVEATEGNKKSSRQIYFDQGDVYLLSGDLDEVLTEDDLEVGLVAAGLVTEDQLADAAAQQMKDEVYEMFLWEGAEFEYSADYLPSEFYTTKGTRKIKLNTVNFLLAAVQRIAAWEQVRNTLPSDQMVLAFDSNVAKMNTVSEKGNEDLLLLADGRHAISDLVRMSRTRRFKALTLLADLVTEGTLKVVDLDQIEEEDEDALFATDLPTSGVIEEGFVGQIQFVGTLQDLAGAKLTGVMRVTDGRRSKEMALADGGVFRTNPYHPRPKVASSEAAAPAVVVLSPEAERVAEIEAMDLDALDEAARKSIEMELKLLKMVVAEQAPPEPEPEAVALSPEAERVAEIEAMDLDALDEAARKSIEMELKLLKMVVAEQSPPEPEPEPERAPSAEETRVGEIEALDLASMSDEERAPLEMELKLLKQQIELDQAAHESGEGLTDEEAARREFEKAMQNAAQEMEEEKRRKEEAEAIQKEAAIDTAQNFSECFSWRGTRFELLKGTLPPKLKDLETREAYRLHAETFFDVVAEAGERWVKVGELVPKDLALRYTSDEAAELAKERAGEHTELPPLVDGNNTTEDVARISGKRYQAMSWMVDLFEEGLVEAVEPEATQEGDAEEDWDFSL